VPKRLISIEPAWRFRNHLGQQLEPALFDVLAAIGESGKLTEAAKRAGYSYRHSWNLLKRWSEFFGAPLATLTQGRGARLTPLGEKLAWAAQRIHARLGPQLDNLAAEIDLEMMRAIHALKPIVRIHASYGFAVARLPQFAAEHSDVRVDLQYVGSLEAFSALARGNCDLAGFHVPLGRGSDELRARFERNLKPRPMRVIKLVTRTQGLFLARGNPKGVRALADLASRHVRFINRQQQSGTRLLFDLLLAEAGVRQSSIAGYETAEFTHSAVAAFVASGMADAGFGVQPAAAQFKLDFVPLAQEAYCLAGRDETWETPAVRTLLALIGGRKFAASVRELAGYDTIGAGKSVDPLQLMRTKLGVPRPGKTGPRAGPR